LVIQLETQEEKSRLQIDNCRQYLESLAIVCHVVLLEEDAPSVLGFIAGNGRRTRRDKKGRVAATSEHMNTMAGQRTCGGTILIDPEDGLPKLFFVFPDLSVKVLGRYRLQCFVFDMQSYFLT
jgi:hypothetical protein